MKKYLLVLALIIFKGCIVFGQQNISAASIIIRGYKDSLCIYMHDGISDTEFMRKIALIYRTFFGNSKKILYGFIGMVVMNILLLNPILFLF